jgi:hypothetical protein
VTATDQTPARPRPLVPQPQRAESRRSTNDALCQEETFGRLIRQAERSPLILSESYRNELPVCVIHAIGVAMPCCLIFENIPPESRLGIVYFCHLFAFLAAFDGRAGCTAMLMWR